MSFGEHLVSFPSVITQEQNCGSCSSRHFPALTLRVVPTDVSSSNTLFLMNTILVSSKYSQPVIVSHSAEGVWHLIVA